MSEPRGSGEHAGGEHSPAAGDWRRYGIARLQNLTTPAGALLLALPVCSHEIKEVLP